MPLWFIIQDIKHLTGTDRDYRPSDAWSRKPPVCGVYMYAIYMLGYLEQIVSAVFTWEKKITQGPGRTRERTITQIGWDVKSVDVASLALLSPHLPRCSMLMP